jgi:hypothetical protein
VSKLSTEELTNLLELEKQYSPYVCIGEQKQEEINERYKSQLFTIGPQAVRELLEARELLCNHLIELQECRKTLSAYGHSSNWMAEIDRLIKRTREYLGE